MIQLQGPRSKLRQWQFTDDVALVKYANDADVARYLADRFPHPYTQVDAQNWLNYIVDARPVVNLVIEVDGELAGGIGVDLKQGERRKTAHMGYWLGKPFWGRGIMPEATGLFVKYIFDNFDIVRIETGVYHPNTASMRVLEKCGFVTEGIGEKAIFKNGELYDEHLYALVR